MTPALLASVARSVDAPRPLVPHLAALFGGLESLGSSPRMVVGALRRAGIGADDRVVDLACGKGAIAAAAARLLGCRVQGVDAYPPFLKAAVELAARARVDGRCEWCLGDARRFRLGRRAPCDAALMIGLDSLSEAAPRLRRLVRVGGVYIIDDLVAMRGRWAADPAGDGVPTRREARAFIEGLGDSVIEASPMDAAQIRRISGEIAAGLRAAARRLGAQHPRLRPALARFVQGQREAGELLAGPLRPLLFVVRRGGAGPR